MGKRIGCHDATGHGQALVAGFDAGDFGTVHTAHLACAHADGHFIFGVNNGVGLNKFCHGPGELEVALLLGGRLNWLTTRQSAVLCRSRS